MKIPKEIIITLTKDKFNLDKEIILTRKGNKKILYIMGLEV